MSTTAAPTGLRRVRHLAKDALALMAFSAIVAIMLAGLLMLLLTVLG